MTSSRTKLLAAASVAAFVVSSPLHAQDGEATLGDPVENYDDEIVVVADRLRGQVESAQPPILELDEQEIAAYGVGSIAELVTALAPQTGSGRGRGDGPPVFLVNGMRVSSFREMRSYPPEAILRVEVLPEETAQRYGFSADQRLINFILKDGFSSREIEVEYEQPGDGGTSRKEVEATYLKIDGPSRLNLNLGWEDTSLLTEAEREVVQSSFNIPGLASDPDPAEYRSLISDSASLEATANLSTKLGDAGGALSLNGSFERDKSRSLSGLDTVTLTDPGDNSLLRSLGAEAPLEQRRESRSYSLGSTVNLPVGDWQFTATLDANRSETETEIDRYADTTALAIAAAAGELAIDGPLPELADAGFDTANTLTHTLDSLVTMVGSPLYLPAGPVSLTLDGGYKWNRIESEDTRNPGVETGLTRGRLSSGANLGIPIASRRDDVWAWLGDFTLNFSAGVDHLSDFGTLTDWTGGFVWGVTETLSLQGSYIARDTAPSLTQLGSSEIVTLNVPVYDLAQSETVLASITSGGNPGLGKQQQRDIRLAAMWEMPLLGGSNIMVEYFRNRSDNVSASFPLLTPAIEAAFPDRVTRDASGRLVAIDQRPVTFAEQNSSRLKIGLNLSGELGSSDDDSSSRQGGGQAAAPVRPQAVDAPGAGPRGPDPERFAALRQRLCVDGETPDISELPEPMQQRLRGADGAIDPERLEQFKTRLCSDEAPRFAGRQAAQDGAAPPADAPPADGAQAGGPPPGGPPPGIGGGRGRGGFRGPGGRGGGGRWFANINYTLELENEVLIADGLPVLDLLDGDALSGGGVVRHSADLSGGLFYNGFGMRFRGNYSGPSRVDGSGLPGSSDLRFGSLATLDLRLFADLGRREKLVDAVPFLEGTRVSFSVDNLFDSRRTVTDENGVVPLGYQPRLIDPEGRTFEIEFRKLF